MLEERNEHKSVSFFHFGPCFIVKQSVYFNSPIRESGVLENLQVILIGFLVLDAHIISTIILPMEFSMHLQM